MVDAGIVEISQHVLGPRLAPSPIVMRVGPVPELLVMARLACLRSDITRRPREERALFTASFDLEAIRVQRASWGLFRDRRPELYGALTTSDGGNERK